MDQVSHAIVSSTSNVENGPTTIKTTMAPTSDNVPANTPTTAVPEQRETYPRTTSPLSYNHEEHPRGSVYQSLPSLPSAQTKRSTAGDLRILSNHNINRPEVDWIVPVEKPRTLTVGERLQPTLDTAEAEKAKYTRKAAMTGYALNIAIGLQVLLGALTTGLSAALTGRTTSIGVSILGGLSTLVASYLARVRGSNEPELSRSRVKDLAQFIRECQAFQMDHGLSTGHEHDADLDRFRGQFEELLGNGNVERRLSTPV